MRLTCYIIDDEFHAIEVIARYIDRTPGLELVGTSTDPLEALEKFTDGLVPDLAFLDLDMPQLNGLDMADLLEPSTSVIFTTSFREYGPEAFEKDAVDYLLKPITYPRFLQAITKATAAITPSAVKTNSAFFFVKGSVKGKFYRINIEEIKYIENIGNYITIHFINDHEAITTYLTLAEVLTKLPEKDFSRIHQSFVIHHDSIVSLEYAQVRLKEKLTLPIGTTYRSAFRDKMHRDILISKRDSRQI